jgi:hypothetical protein
LLNRRPAGRALAAAAAAVAVALPLGIIYPAAARVAAVRLVDPFGDHPWPPQTALTVEAPDWIARGEPFVLRATLEGVIPERATFAFAIDGTPTNEQPVPVMAVEVGGSFAVRLEPNRVPRNFRYRVRANDAETPWRAVRVLTPPQLAALDGRPSPQIHLAFPAYTDLPPFDLPDGASALECVTGTLVRARAATERPVESAWVELAAEQPRPVLAAGLLSLGGCSPAGVLALTAAGHAVWGRVPAVLGADGQQFEVAFRPYVGGLYGLRYEDESGLAGRRTIDVRLQPDPSPAVTLERPAASQDSLHVLADATLPLVARVDDPVFAVRSAWLEYRCGAEPTQVAPIYHHATLGAAVPQLLSAASPPLRLRLQRVAVERRLEIKQYRHADGRPLSDGDTLTIQVVANDFDDVTVPKPPGRSHELELRIVTPAALLTTLQKAEADVQRELTEMLRLQRDALERTTAAETQRRQSGTLRPEDRERLVQAEQLQQQLRGRLGNHREGLRADVDRLRRALRDNPLPKSPERDRLDALDAEFDRLAREELEPIEPQLAQARTERGPVSPEARKNGPLPSAVEHQREAERTLKDLLDQMRPWTDAREVRAEAAALARDQEKAARDRAELESKGSIGKPLDQLSPEQRQQLDRQAERQSALADRASELLEKVNRKLAENQAAASAKESEAAAKEVQAAEMERQAAPAKPEGARPQKAGESAQEAHDLRQQAHEAREAAAAQRREADALAAARDAAQNDPAQAPNNSSPQDPTLSGRQKEAAEKLARNEVGQARQAQEAADRMLKAMQDALQEKSTPDGDRLAKKQKLVAAENELEQLIRSQERLQQRADEAAQIADPNRRKQELERLAREEEQLQQRARDLAQRLTRLGGERAGQELRRAARAMDQARDAMDQGDPAAGDKQEDALDRLDDAQDQLAQSRKDTEEELQREMRARLLDTLKGLKERQERQVAESERLFQAAKQGGGWSRPLQKSLADLAAAEAALGGEVGPLVDRHFRDAKVIAHLVQQAAEALAAVKPAVDAVRNGPMDLDSLETDRGTVQAPERSALKRLTQLIDALEEDDKDRQAGRNQPGGGDSAGGGAAGDGIPPLAQMKLLRALQAEVNERTEAFGRAHPDVSKLTPKEQAELDAIHGAQADLAALLEELTPADSSPEGARLDGPDVFVGGLAVQPEPPPDKPPDRLEKKPRPADRPMPQPPPNEDKDKPQEDPTDEAAKLREKIAEEMRAAEKKLKDRDPGRDTRQLQDEALQNIDKLIDLARKPPPPQQQQQPMDGSLPPMGGDQQQQQSDRSQPQPGTQQRPQSGRERRERREQRRRQVEQQARGGGQRQQSQPQQGDQKGGGQSPGDSKQSGMGGIGSRRADQMADIVKDIWGHLPETLRQEVDHYYRDRFMPRYRDLVQEYYMRLAERERGRGEDRK